jgi:Transposase and inactivated derivatives
MNPFVCPDKIVISRYPHDMRAGIQRLAQIVTTEFGLDPTDGSLYIFVSRKSDKLKMLRFETSGWCLYYCRLCEGTFKWQHNENSTDPLLVIERRQLIWLLEGLAITQPNAPKPVTATTIL